MLHSVEYLCSVVVAFARLARALMSLCSPRSVVAARVPPARATKKVRPAMAIAIVTALVDDSNDQLPAALPPPVLVLPAFKATAKRPSRLVIPPPVARAGVDPFGEACPEAEAEVAAEVEAQGEGFCVASRRGVRHAMEDAYGAITDEIAEDSRLVNMITSSFYLQPNYRNLQKKNLIYYFSQLR